MASPQSPDVAIQQEEPSRSNPLAEAAKARAKADELREEIRRKLEAVFYDEGVDLIDNEETRRKQVEAEDKAWKSFASSRRDQGKTARKSTRLNSTSFPAESSGR